MSELSSPELSWKDEKTPVSDRFDDVYFSADDGIAESMYVFINGCGMPEAFEGKTSFSVAETGFGTGLNFLLTWKTWKESGTDCELNYVSVEGYPLTKEQLEQAYKTFPGLDVYANEFLQHYPHTIAGYHHIILEEGKVKLTLMFGEAAEEYAKLDGPVNAWYLDGFAPSKNPEMWRAEVFEQMGRLSVSDAIVSTFTAAGFVKRGLQDVGFEMTKRRGFGRKRESLIGAFTDEKTKLDAPWFAKPVQLKAKKKIAVIGGGIAGCVSAYRLVQDGHDVTLFERNSLVGQEGSGNRLGLLKPRLVMEQDTIGRFNTISYLHALAFYESLEGQVFQGERGLFDMFEDEEAEQRMKTFFDKGILPISEMEFISADEASDRLGIKAPRGGLWYPNSGVVAPSNLCQLIGQDITVQTNVEISAIEKSNDSWMLKSGDQIVFQGDCVVIANAGEAKTLNPYFDIPMGGRRGQVCYVKATAETEKLKHAVSYGGYMIPAKDGDHVVGASFERWTDFSDHSYKEHQDESQELVLTKLKKFLPDLNAEVIGTRANMRAMLPDHYPIVGPVFEDTVYERDYRGLNHGKKAVAYKEADYIDGLYVMCGLGARGIQSAPLLADILSSYINGTPSPVERVIREGLHPARFIIRKLKKGKL